MTLTLAIDQGTHASRALLFDARGEPLADHLLPVALSRPLPGHAEQDASGILDALLGFAAASAIVPEVVVDGRAVREKPGRFGQPV